MGTGIKLIMLQLILQLSSNFAATKSIQNESRTSQNCFCIELGSENLKGSFGFGKREDYTYDVPDEVIHVSLNSEDKSSNDFNLGSGNGKVTLTWDKLAKKAYVHAWVNGAVGDPNEVRWTIYAWLKP